MRVVNIYKKNENGNKKFLNKAFFESKKGKWNIEENLKEIMLRQNHEDILKLGTNAEMENIGVEVFYFHDGIWCSWDADDSSHIWQNAVTFKDSTIQFKVYLAFEIYPQGYVLEVKNQNNPLNTYYVHGIVKNKMKITPNKEEAKKWISIKYVSLWWQNNIEVIRFFAEKGWNYQLKPHNRLAQRDEVDLFSRIRLTYFRNMEEQFYSFYKQCEMVNGTVSHYEMSEVLLDDKKAIEEHDIKAEAVKRMRTLQLSERVIEEFVEQDRIYMSEYVGFIAELNEVANVIVERVKKLNIVPYHIIRGRPVSGQGEVYSVLYVSFEVENWKEERVDGEGKMMMWNLGREARKEKGKVEKMGEGIGRT